MLVAAYETDGMKRLLDLSFAPRERGCTRVWERGYLDLSMQVYEY